MNHCDYLICGGGLSGMMLVYFMARSNLADKNILIIEKSLSNRYKREWSFWIDTTHPFETVVKHQWNSISGNFTDKNYILNLNKYKFQLIFSTDLFRFIQNELNNHPNIKIIEGEVQSLKSKPNLVQIKTNNSIYTCDYLFSSVRLDGEMSSKNYMSGCSWLVELETDYFDTNNLTFCDFRTELTPQTGFFYTLPLTPKTALIYFASFAKNSNINQFKLINPLNLYLSHSLGLKKYRLIQREAKSYKLGNNNPTKRFSSRAYYIGAAAGLIDSSTSYGFVNILDDCRQIVKSLCQQNSIQPNKSTNIIFKLGDLAMNHLIKHQPQNLAYLFQNLFAQTPSGDELLKFLDKKSSLKSQIKLMGKINPKIFMGAAMPNLVR